MKDDWVMLVTGVLLVVFGFKITHTSGAMPGSTLRGPVPLRLRVILVSFGVLMFMVGLLRLVRG